MGWAPCALREDDSLLDWTINDGGCQVVKNVAIQDLTPTRRRSRKVYDAARNAAVSAAVGTLFIAPSRVQLSDAAAFAKRSMPEGSSPRSRA